MISDRSRDHRPLQVSLTDQRGILRSLFIIKKAILSKSQNVKDRSHANKYLIKTKVNIWNKVGICISTYSNADVECHSATCRTGLNDVRLIVAGSLKLTENHLFWYWLSYNKTEKHGRSCGARVRHFQPRFIISECRIHYRASSV